MKRSVIAALLIIFTMSFSAFSGIYIKNHTQTISRLATLTRQNISYFPQLREEWVQSKKLIALTVKKELIEPVDMLLFNLENSDENTLNEYCNRIASYCEEIRRFADFSLYNIF